MYLEQELILLLKKLFQEKKYNIKNILSLKNDRIFYC